MNLEELLGELRTNILRDDAELASGPSDTLWTDDSLVLYINDAQKRFARRTLSLRDSTTPEVVEVALVSGIATYALNASVLAVVSARFDTDTHDLTRVGRAVLAIVRPEDNVWFDSNNIAAMTPGRPRAFSTDEGLEADSKAVMLTVYPTPTDAEDGLLLNLRVARLPLVDFSIDKLNVESEIDEMYQLDMLEWAAFRALRNSDIDGHSSAAKDHEKRFNDAAQEVLKDIRRKMRAPMRFEFGRGGFAWEN